MVFMKKMRKFVFKLLPAGFRISIASFLVYQFYIKPKNKSNKENALWRVF